MKRLGKAWAAKLPTEPPPAAPITGEAQAARASLSEFVRQAWPLVEPAPLVWGWHVEAICKHLEAVARGEIRKLLINVPPGHAKSLLVAVLFPSWLWIDRPEWRSIFASYSDDLSVRDSIRCRQVIESNWYQENFATPDGWRMRSDQNVKSYFVNTRSGFRLATSVQGRGTGDRGDLVVIDDPLKAQDAYSKAKRLEANRWLGQTMSNRFNDMQAGRMVMIMQRLHEEDPSGFVLEGGGWEHLCLPSEFDPANRSVTYHTVNGVRARFWADPRTEEGELLFPQKFPKEVLQEAKAPNQLGADGFAGQHQQRPTPATGGMFKRDCWRFWKPDGAAPDHIAQRPAGCYDGPALPLPKLVKQIVSVDATFKETQSGSFVAIHVWGKAEGSGRFLLDRIKMRMDFDSTCKALKSICARHPRARRKIIEEKANGSAILSTLGRQIPGMVGVEPEGGKEARAAATQPYQAAGNVFLPDGAPWLDDYISEHAAFPLGKYNDDVDAQSQALNDLEQDETTAEKWRRIKE